MRVIKVTKVHIKNSLFLKNKVNLGFNFRNVTYVTNLVTLVFRVFVLKVTLHKFKLQNLVLFCQNKLQKLLTFVTRTELHKLRKESKPCLT